MSSAAAAYLVLLPCATALLGAALSLLDRAGTVPALRRLAWRGLPFLAAALLLGRAAALPALLAVLTALTVHVAAGSAIRLALRRGWLTGAATAWWTDE